MDLPSRLPQELIDRTVDQIDSKDITTIQHYSLVSRRWSRRSRSRILNTYRKAVKAQCGDVLATVADCLEGWSASGVLTMPCAGDLVRNLHLSFPLYHGRHRPAPFHLTTLRRILSSLRNLQSLALLAFTIDLDEDDALFPPAQRVSLRYLHACLPFRTSLQLIRLLELFHRIDSLRITQRSSLEHTDSASFPRTHEEAKSMLVQMGSTAALQVSKLTFDMESIGPLLLEILQRAPSQTPIRDMFVRCTSRDSLDSLTGFCCDGLMSEDPEHVAFDLQDSKQIFLVFVSMPHSSHIFSPFCSLSGSSFRNYHDRSLPYAFDHTEPSHISAYHPHSTGTPRRLRSHHLTTVIAAHPASNTSSKAAIKSPLVNLGRVVLVFAELRRSRVGCTGVRPFQTDTATERDL